MFGYKLNYLSRAIQLLVFWLSSNFHIIIVCLCYVSTFRQEYPLLQDKDEGAQERQPQTTGLDPRGQVPNLRGPDLGLYKWKPDLQEA